MLSKTEKLILELRGIKDPTEEMLMDMAEKADVTVDEFMRTAATLAMHDVHISEENLEEIRAMLLPKN